MQAIITITRSFSADTYMCVVQHPDGWELTIKTRTYENNQKLAAIVPAFTEMWTEATHGYAEANPPSDGDPDGTEPWLSSGGASQTVNLSDDVVAQLLELKRRLNAAPEPAPSLDTRIDEALHSLED